MLMMTSVVADFGKVVVLLSELAVQLVQRLVEYVFKSCCGLCCFWNLKCSDLLSCCDLSLAFFGLVLYSTKKFHCPQAQKALLLQVFNLGVEIFAE